MLLKETRSWISSQNNSIVCIFLSKLNQKKQTLQRNINPCLDLILRFPGQYLLWIIPSTICKFWINHWIFNYICTQKIMVYFCWWLFLIFRFEMQITPIDCHSFYWQKHEHGLDGGDLILKILNQSLEKEKICINIQKMKIFKS